MDIYFLGLTALRLKGKKTTLVVDPFTKESAKIIPGGRQVKFEATEADGVLITSKHVSHISADQVNNYRVVIDGPGEYELGGATIVGIPVFDQTTYYVKMDGINLLHLGGLRQSFTDSDLDKFPSIDILFIAVTKEAADIIAKLEPKIVIPLHFDEAALALFLKAIGKEGIKPISKLTITKEKLPSEMEVVVLE